MLASRISISLLIALGLAAPAAAIEYPRAQLLVEPAELTESEARKQVVILDARERAQYDAGHVPGARWVNHAEWSKVFEDGADQAGWTKRIGELGLEPSTPVVVYDDNLAKDASRIWWILCYWGLENVRLLNGGWHGWKSARSAIESDPPPAARTTDPKLVPAKDRLSTKQQLLASLAGGSLQIVDARSENEFCGIDVLNNKRAGSIPGAKQLEWSDLIDKSTQRFKSADELKKLFDDAGIDLQRPTATHCQSGGRASVMVFGMELMGAKDVSNYYRSWSEWGNADDTPVIPGKVRGSK